MKLSKTTLVLAGLAMVCYALAQIEIAIVLGVLGIQFELFMYISMLVDRKKQEKRDSVTTVKERDGEPKRNT
jgi:hypothetical protein